VVLSLGGGGNRTMAHIAVIHFLEKMRATKFISEVWGTSGGSLIALLYSLGLKAEKIRETMETLIGKGNKVQLTPSLFGIMKTLVKDLWGNTKENMKGFHDAREAFEIAIGHYVKDYKEKCPLFCLAYNTDNDQTEVLTPHEMPESMLGEWIFKAHPMDAVIASSSIPILFVPKVISNGKERRVYVDGGTNEEIPSVSVYKKWIRERELGIESRKKLLVIAVNVHAEFASLGFMDNWILRQLPAFNYVNLTIKYADLIRKARFEDQKRLLMSDSNVEFWDIHLGMKGGGLLSLEMVPKVIANAERLVPMEFDRINQSLLI